MKRPRFTIITATKNRRDWLPRAVNSVIAQTFTDWELVIVDGSDEPHDYGWGALPIRYEHQPNPGPAAGFQLALDLAQGEIIHPLSDDDQLPPDALAFVNREIGHHEWGYGLTAYQNEAGETQFLLGDTFDLDRLRAGYYLGGAVYWRRHLTDKLGGFNSKYDGAADYDLYLRFAEHAEPVFWREVLYLYTDHPGTDSHVRHANQQFQTARIREAHAAAH